MAKRKDVKVPEKYVLLPEETANIQEETQEIQEVFDEVKRSKVPYLEVKESEVKDFTHDSEFENLILGFWGFSEIKHFQNFKKFRQACVLYDLRNEYEYFKKQCENYKIFTELIGLKFKHKFANFLGNQENAFEDGAWNEENWELKIAEEKEKSSGKKENKGAVAVIENFSQNMLRQS